MEELLRSIPAEHHPAIRWARTRLDADFTEVGPLTGGLTSTMYSLTDVAGAGFVLRLMTREPWRTHGPHLVTRESRAVTEVEGSGIPVPGSLALDAEGAATGYPAHLMTRLPGVSIDVPSTAHLDPMIELLQAIHAVAMREPFRTFQSWAWEAKWRVPPWSARADLWERAFAVLRQREPAYEPTVLHRDFSHRNLLWSDGQISGVVDWVETSTGPAWLDVAHAATNLALASGPSLASDFVARAERALDGLAPTHWLVMDAVGFLPPPGRPALFDAPHERGALEEWLQLIV